MVKCFCPWHVKEDEYDIEQGLAQEKVLASKIHTKKSITTKVEKVVNRLQFLPLEDVTSSLLYLTLFDERDPEVRSPFPFHHQKAILASAQATLTAKRWLWFGGTGAVITVGLSMLTSGWVNKDQDDGLYAFSLCTGLISAIASVLATGTYPDISSNQANLRQDALHEVQRIYENIAFHFVELSFDEKPLADEIAEKLDLASVVETLMKELSQHETNVLVQPLKEAYKFVIKGKMPIHTKGLQAYIQGRQQVLEIRELKKRIKKLEKRNFNT